MWLDWSRIILTFSQDCIILRFGFCAEAGLEPCQDNSVIRLEVLLASEKAAGERNNTFRRKPHRLIHLSFSLFFPSPRTVYLAFPSWYHHEKDINPPRDRVHEELPSILRAVLYFFFMFLATKRQAWGTRGENANRKNKARETETRVW